MSLDNVEIVRSAFLAFNRSDPRWDEHWAEDCEFVSITGGQIEGATYRGHDGLRRYAKDRLDAWEELRFEPDEFIDAGELVVVVGILTGRGRGSGVPVDQPVAVAFELRAGKIVRAHAHTDAEQALATIGSREQR
jgi:ketosteroid isomerase-like protein